MLRCVFTIIFAMIFATFFWGQTKKDLPAAANFSCTTSGVTDNDGNLNGWAVVTLVQTDEHQFSERLLFRSEDWEKALDFCHKWQVETFKTIVRERLKSEPKQKGSDLKSARR